MSGNICRTVQYGLSPRPDDWQQFLERPLSGLYTTADLRLANDVEVAQGIVSADTLYKQALIRFAENLQKGDWWASLATPALIELQEQIDALSDSKVKSGMALYFCAKADFISLKMILAESDPSPYKLSEAGKIEAGLATEELRNGIRQLVVKANETIAIKEKREKNP